MYRHLKLLLWITQQLLGDNCLDFPFSYIRQYVVIVCILTIKLISQKSSQSEFCWFYVVDITFELHILYAETIINDNKRWMFIK